MTSQPLHLRVETGPPWLKALKSTPVVGALRKCGDYFRGRYPYSRLHRYRWYVLLVVLPTLVSAIYYSLIAANQYETETHFIVINPSQDDRSAGALGQLLGNAPGGETETLAVLDYMQSLDAVGGLQKQLDLIGIYRKPDIDIFARVQARPTLEALYEYLFLYGRMVRAYFDFTTNVGVLKVYAFEAHDSQQIADKLLVLGDQLVDRLNKRAEQDALRVARDEVDRAEKRVAATQEKITNFRLHQQEFDLTKSTDAILDVIAKLEAELAQAQADLTSARTYLTPNSPKYQELTNHITALQDQINTQKARLTGADGALAPTLASYEGLLLERQFADRDYELAMKSLEEARLQAEKQHLFLVRVVEPNLAQASEYPRGLFITFSIFACLTVAYGIGWLIAAGVREHAG